MVLMPQPASIAPASRMPNARRMPRDSGCVEASMFSSPDGVKKTGMGFMGALRPKQALLQQRMANPGPYSCRPFIPESLPSATAAGSSRGLAKRYENRPLVADKQVKIGRSCADFECCENGTKAKFI